VKQRLLLLLLVLGIARPPGVWAQEASGDGALKLSLQESVALAVANSFDIRLAELDRLIAQTRNKAALAPFDPVLTADLHYELDEAKAASSIAGTRSTETVMDLELEKKLQTGTTLTTTFANERASSNSAFASLNPSFTTSLEAGITQAVAKNAGGIIDRAKVEITRLEVENKDLAAIDRIEASVAEVTTAYWELVLAREQMRIQEEALERAQALDQANQDKFGLGLIEEPELLHSAANVHLRREELVVAQNQTASALQNFKLLLSERSDIAIEPTESLAFDRHPAEFQESLRRAWERRRDLVAARREVKRRRVKIRMTQNDLLPSVDLVASFRANGLDQKYGPSLNQALKAEDPTYFVGLKASWTFGNKGASADHEEAQLQKAQALVELAFLERRILRDVDEAVRELLRWETSVESREAIEELYQRRLILQERRFELGRSNVQTLIDFQEDLLAAQRSKAEALVRHHQAGVALERTENTLLTTYGLES